MEDRHATLVTNVRNAVSSSFCGKPHLQFFCSDACCLRYLKARNMDEGKAIKLLQETLSWYVLLIMLFSDCMGAANIGQSRARTVRCETSGHFSRATGAQNMPP